MTRFAGRQPRPKALAEQRRHAVERLFDIPPGYPVPQNGDPYAVSPDGQRFLMARVFETGAAETQRMVLVTNFLAEIRRLAPD